MSDGPGPVTCKCEYRVYPVIRVTHAELDANRFLFDKNQIDLNLEGTHCVSRFAEEDYGCPAGTMTEDPDGTEEGGVDNQGEESVLAGVQRQLQELEQ